MSMSVGSDSGEDQVMSEINTTPLVDIMLVLLIIFLITSPVVLKLQKIDLPIEANQALQSKPDNVNIVVNKDGEIYLGQKRLKDTNELFDYLKVEAVKVPQPEVHVRGDQEARYESIGRVIFTTQRAGIQKVGFITEPPDKG
ncbi:MULTISPECIES: biopolymer transporter ExbD [unclassified Janthinobacterium]|jgi:biopolymer transport protein ExbD|uniref:ExbD/TolR family protein n=1 Tax=unclassified Janthinobacterium TaxID=2610881 RepID=UPI00161C5A45|nr:MULTISPECIES: biopolymer transporter ExbD [unclassified Janthinobacterium]MBB5367547.1 biopolymer transport protein ExbD [Janthinobacterium sp. K2C7]MBB5379975.1 biopolymer transport protein ExbD [Janthinobacterium sp. K2Li3]MBB5385929.1 biopolymer transport protein ExbD [Janthinobacterium sp. K2E3]MBB5608764.1 biopolymer transport protein ExbD [Janthinobacterium sp. S3T4]MBB5613833.1 biopolymer transport protein ExbD [Janthinobacterium sp. S3M3]